MFPRGHAQSHEQGSGLHGTASGSGSPFKDAVSARDVLRLRWLYTSNRSNSFVAVSVARHAEGVDLVLRGQWAGMAQVLMPGLTGTAKAGSRGKRSRASAERGGRWVPPRSSNLVTAGSLSHAERPHGFAAVFGDRFLIRRRGEAAATRPVKAAPFSGGYPSAPERQPLLPLLS